MHSTHSTITSNRAVNQSYTPPASMAWDHLNPFCRLVSRRRLNFRASVEEPMETLALSHYSETHLEVISSRQIRTVLRRIKHSQTRLPDLSVSQLRTSASSSRTQWIAFYRANHTRHRNLWANQWERCRAPAQRTFIQRCTRCLLAVMSAQASLASQILSLGQGKPQGRQQTSQR